MSKARKLPSGSWNIVLYDYKDADGKEHYHSITKATKAELNDAAAEWKLRHKGKRKDDITVGEAVDKYIALSEMLSPTTLHRYQQIRENAFTDLMGMYTSDLTDTIIQEAINNEGKRLTPKGTLLSAKTVQNEYGLISSALKAVCKKTFQVRLPKKQKGFIELPPAIEVLRIVKDTDIELPCLLSMWLTFSMSEIRGIMCSSIRNGCIYIERVKVYVGRTQVVKDDAKTESRKRVHRVPTYIMRLIEKNEAYQRYITTGEDGYLIPCSADSLYERFTRRMAKHGYKMTFHQLRHEAASIMLLLNIPDKYAQERGGWSTDHIMKGTYQHTFSAERQAVDRRIDDFFNDMIDTIFGFSEDQPHTSTETDTAQVLELPHC